MIFLVWIIKRKLNGNKGEKINYGCKQIIVITLNKWEVGLKVISLAAHLSIKFLSSVKVCRCNYHYSCNVQEFILSAMSVSAILILNAFKGQLFLKDNLKILLLVLFSFVKSDSNPNIFCSQNKFGKDDETSWKFLNLNWNSYKTWSYNLLSF